MTWSKKSRQARGYGAAWDRTRERILRRDNGLCKCEHCTAEGLLTPAGEVDHVIPRGQGGSDDDSNLQAINHDCHKRKTIEDNGGKRIERPAIGIDGFPKGW